MNFLFITLALTCFVSVYSADWSYKGHADWGNAFPNCKLNQQSPIKINSHTAKYYNKLGAFTLKNFDKMMEFKIKNDGHTIKLTPPQSDMTSSAGGLPSTYTVAQFHFHWSQGDKSKGSEHILDDKAYPLELHIVQVNNNYGNITEALKHSDGLAVFGFFFKEGATNKGLSKFVKKIPEVGIDSKSEMFSISQLIESEHDMDNYFRYEGSLTTPPCSQAVVWTVFNKILTADASQLADIWGVKDHDGNTISNYRPIQKLNGRVVHASFTASSGTMTTALSVLVFFSLFMVTNLW